MPGGDFHPSDQAHSRAHDRRRLGGPGLSRLTCHVECGDHESALTGPAAGTAAVPVPDPTGDDRQASIGILRARQPYEDGVTETHG